MDESFYELFWKFYDGNRTTTALLPHLRSESKYRVHFCDDVHELQLPIHELLIQEIEVNSCSEYKVAGKYGQVKKWVF